MTDFNIIVNPCPSATVENSDGSYSVNVAAGGVLPLPNQDIEVNGVNEGVIPSVGTIEIDLTDGTNPVAANSVSITGRNVSIDVSGGGVSQGGLLPFQSGQTTVYTTGDDGSTQRGQDFFTIPFTNPFGNTTRFLDTLGGTAYADGITLDMATTQWATPTTGTFMGYVFVNLSTTFVNQVTNALAAVHGGLSGWSIINNKEMYSLTYDNGVVNDSLNHSGLLVPDNIQVWTGKTNSASTAQAIGRTNSGFINALSKTTNGRRIDARLFSFNISGSTVIIS